MKAGIVCTQVVLMRQMLYDIVGKPWTWADLSEVALLPDGSTAEARGAVCPLSSKALVGATPDTIARAWCIGGTVRKCSRLASRHAYEEWVSLPAAVRGKRAPAYACPTCGGFLGPAPAWELPSPPKRGWAPAARVGWLQGAYTNARGRVSKTCDVQDKDIVLISAASAAQCDYPWREFGLDVLAFDEAHHIASPSISQIVAKVPCARVFGVSATPARLDGSEHAIYMLLGPTAFVYKRTREVTGKTGSVRVRQVTYTQGAQKEVVYRDGRLGFATMVAALVADAARNRLITALASDAVRQGRKKILVITSTIQHTAVLASALKELGFFDTTVLRGGVKPAVVAHAQQPSTRIVVATYHYLAEGFDDPRIDTVIFAAPRSFIQQALGRCERTMDGKLVPLVFDIVDPFSLFLAMARKRMAFYKSRSFATSREKDDETWERMEQGGDAGDMTDAVSVSDGDMTDAASVSDGDMDCDDGALEEEEEDVGE